MVKKEAEKKFIELLSKVPNVAVQGYNKERTVIYWNKASEHIYGYTENEALGQKLEDLIIPDFMQNEVIKHVENWYKNGIKIPAGELPLKNKNGSTVYVYSSHVMLGEDTNDPEMFCIDIDLTQNKEQEKTLHENEKILALQSKTAAVGEMLGNISHQWRQPLSVIATHASIIKTDINLNEKLNNKDLLNHMDTILKNTTYLSQTIEDFRSFFKADTTHIERFNIKDALINSFNLITDTLKDNYIKFEKELETIHILNNQNQLIQATLNICNNAKDSMIENIPDTEKRLFFISLKQVKENAIITFKDSGGGVDPMIMDKIFEPYFTTKHQSIGTGIGLYMTSQIITKHFGGTITVKNVEYMHKGQNYKGAEFIISLPLRLN